MGIPGGLSVFEVTPVNAPVRPDRKPLVIELTSPDSGGRLESALVEATEYEPVTLRAYTYFGGEPTKVQLWSNRSGRWEAEDAVKVADRPGWYEIQVPASQDFEFTFRFSVDEGRTWLWADLPFGNGRVSIESTSGDAPRNATRELAAAA